MKSQINQRLSQLKQEKIAVIYGGYSAEREVSLRSGEAIAKGLSAAGFNVVLFDPKVRPLHELSQLSIDRAFIALHGRGGEDGSIQGALEYLNIPYTGSKVLGSALAMDKIKSKQVWQALSLPTAKFAIVNRDNYKPEIAEQILAELNHKVMVKPSHEGSSIGMAKAETAEQLMQALSNAFTLDSEVLVEQWINGPEYTIAILGDIALPVIHMETPREFYDYTAKYESTTTQYHCPSGLAETEEQELKQLALTAFKALNAEGWGRVDVMKNEQNQWQLLEANTVPGMTTTSLVPKAAKQQGISFEQLVTQVLLLSCENSHGVAK